MRLTSLYIFVAIWLGMHDHANAQTTHQHIVYFDAGQASISLQQLDSIKQWTALVKQLPNPKILVNTYASDAPIAENNQQLADKRALLLQQCLEREGISLQLLHIESQVTTANDNNNTCSYCGELMVTADADFLYQNIYQKLIKKYLQTGSQVQAQTFWVDPNTDGIYSTQDGLILQIPANTFATQSEGFVKLDIRFLKEKHDVLLHALQTRTADKQFLDLENMIELQASQNGIPVALAPNRNITIISPTADYNNDYQLYSNTKEHWQKTNQKILAGSFYGGEAHFCEGANSSKLAAPNFPVPPSKPTYLDYDSITPIQDKIIADCKFRLEYLESQKVNEKGKPQELSKQQKQREATLKARLDRALIAKEKIKIKASNTNEGLEKEYYSTLAIYNKTRHQLQQQYLKRLDSLGQQQQLLVARCEQYKKDVADLKANYGVVTFAQLEQKIQALNISEKLGHWIKINQLGWLSLGKQSPSSTKDLVPYRIQTDISAYRILAYLMYDNNTHIVAGEVLDDTDIVFWEVPDNTPVKILAITKQGDAFLAALHEVTTSGDPIKLDFKVQPIDTIIEQLKQ